MKTLRLVATLGLLTATGALALAASVQAKEIRQPLGSFGSAAQPSFTEPKGIAVDDSSGDVYVIDGRTEVQSIKVSATAGNFKLKFDEAERELKFNATAEEVRVALGEIVCGGAECLIVTGGPGDAVGSKPYEVRFFSSFDSKNVDQIECEAGSTPLSGGSGCEATTTIDGVNGSISRYHADGTPAPFSALGSNAIDGKGPGADQTPQDGLVVYSSGSASQIAIDNSGGPSQGDLYVTQISTRVVDVFASSGEYLGQLSEFKEGPAAEGSLKPFKSPCGVAVDPAGEVYVGDFFEGIHKYHPVANPVLNADSTANFTPPKLLPVCSVAAGVGPTAGFIFALNWSGEGVFKLDSSSGALQYALALNENSGRLERAVGVSVDLTNGHVLAGRSSEVFEYDASGATAPFPRYTFQLAGKFSSVAASPSGTLYIAREGAATLDTYSPLLIVPDVSTEAASEVTGISATLNGTISAASGPSATCHFQYTTEAAYLADKAIEGHDGFAGAQNAPCEPAGPFSGAATSAVSAKVAGLSVETNYRFRIVGENSNGENTGDVQLLETLGAPLVKGGQASGITDTTAKIAGELNPRGLPSDYAVQYVTQAEFDENGFANATTVPGTSKASGTGFAEVSVQLSGLTPATAYRFRLIASNESGTAIPGKDGAFATFPTPSGLPDARSYEQVSPALKLSDVFPPEPGPQANMGGTCWGCTPGWFKPKMAMQASPDGSAVAYEGGPFAQGLAAGINEYVSGRGEGGWATTALSGPQFAPGLSDEGFLAFSDDLTRGVFHQIEPALSPDAPANYANLYLWQQGAALTPLITTTPPNRLPGGAGSPNEFRIAYAGANAGTSPAQAFSHIVFQANDALSAEVPGIAPEAPAVAEGETDLYEWTGGELHLINVLPGNNATAPNAVIGSGKLLGGDTYDFDHAVSDDGSRIFWSEQPSGQLYVREGATATVKIPDPGKFLTASADGAKVLLSNGHVFNLEDESTADLTEGLGGFQGILGAAEDLSRVYFVDTEALTPPTEENANEEHAEEGEFNLYLSEGGSTIFIGILVTGSAASDNGVGNGTWRSSPGSRTAQVSADGRYLAFSSRASLTGYDNDSAHRKGTCAGGGSFVGFHICLELFEYDAVKGSLACASCNPSGEAPLGGANLALIFSRSLPFRQPQNLPDEGHGRLFFESRDTLSVADKNGAVQDVYEWEPQGVGDCNLPRGCISLISSGQGATGVHAFNQDSHFVDASASGDDVFFTTWNALVPQDKDDQMDLYDARVGGGFEFSAQEPCLGDACKGASSGAPEPESPGTAGFSEAVSKPKPACKKGSVKKRGRCVAKKKKHHHKRAKHNRGAAK